MKIFQFSEYLKKRNFLFCSTRGTYHFAATKGNLGTARGAAQELESALKLHELGEEITNFGLKFEGKEFDIVTKTKLIECKNIDWLKTDINRFKSLISQQMAIAKKLGKTFEFYSKQPIPSSLKEWLNSKGILFFEG